MDLQSSNITAVLLYTAQQYTVGPNSQWIRVTLTCNKGCAFFPIYSSATGLRQKLVMRQDISGRLTFLLTGFSRSCPHEYRIKAVLIPAPLPSAALPLAQDQEFTATPLFQATGLLPDFTPKVCGRNMSS